MFTVGEGLLSNKDFLLAVSELLDESWIVNTNKNIHYYNVPAAFDIEVTSFYEGEELPENKRAVMYIWQFGIWNYVTTGRTWEDLIVFLKALSNVIGLSENMRLIVYVHNLPYEFQFIRKRFEWSHVFLLDERKPVYAVTGGIEFRCSLKLAGGKSLANVGKDLIKYKVDKAVGDLDYEIKRSPLTPLTEKELGYCENDIRVLESYIQEKIEQDGDITKIPLTNTGYVRQYCRKACFKKWQPYHEMMKVLKMSTSEYSQLKRAFQGGFTHANSHYVNKTLLNVGSHDFASSYPAVMVLDKFPMSRAILVDRLNEDELEKLLMTKCCMFDIEIHELIPKLHFEHPLSASKCWELENYVLDNGRVVMAERLRTTITEQDYFIYSKFYSWSKIRVSNFRYYEKNYLPRQMVMTILEFYGDKTTLKGKKGEEVNYMIKKNMTNSTFGMMVTDPVRDELLYENGEYGVMPADLKEAINKYNENIRRFLYYPWGVWVTAHARAHLFSGIIEMQDDYVYSDTDSVKTLNTENHYEYFDWYNNHILEKIDKSAKHFKISTELYSPMGQTIGVWDDEGVFDKFKTLGAKRYLVEKKGSVKLTVAGANKKKACYYLISTGKPFEKFKHNLVIPAENSGRLILTYIDKETSGVLVDYNGVPYQYKELSSVHMEKSEYHLMQSDAFIKYLKGLSDFGD